jgi:hypothetical protein
MHELTPKTIIPRIFYSSQRSPAIVQPSEQTAVSELRALRKKAEKSGKEIGNALLKWQESLGRGKFKQAFMRAGWAESSVYYYIKMARPPVVEDLTAEPTSTPELESQPPDTAVEERVTMDETLDETTDVPAVLQQDPEMPYASERPNVKALEQVEKKLTEITGARVEVKTDLTAEVDEYIVVFHFVNFIDVETLAKSLGEN